MGLVLSIIAGAVWATILPWSVELIVISVLTGVAIGLIESIIVDRWL
jgi:hypothetical protein